MRSRLEGDLRQRLRGLPSALSRAEEYPTVNSTVFYEIKHGVGADYFTVERNRDFSFPLHMHRCYEAVLLLEGEMKVWIEKEEHSLRAGDMILIKPNRVHSFETPVC